jgi:hypothetical protein
MILEQYMSGIGTAPVISMEEPGTRPFLSTRLFSKYLMVDESHVTLSSSAMYLR